MVSVGRENFKSWCPSRNRFFKHAFSSKKKLDPNNIPVFKISFENCLFIEKRSPLRNRWEKFLAFKQIPITWVSNSKAFARHLCCAVWAVLWRHTAILARLAAVKMPAWLSKDAANVASHRSLKHRFLNNALLILTSTSTLVAAMAGRGISWGLRQMQTVLGSPGGCLGGS